MSYDFNKREDNDYSHSYDYLGGVGLGRDEVKADRLKEAQKGKYDLEPVDPPPETEEVVRIATLVHKAKERDALLKKIREVKDRRMEVVWNTSHRAHAYFLWALHCMDREVVNWQSVRRGNPQRRVSEAPPPQRSIKIRDNVEVSNLKARPELNGKTGTVTGENETNTRWLVEFSDIMQTVSISRDNCTWTNKVISSTSKTLPRGLKVEIRKLTSDTGKLLNGMEAYISEFNADSQRYLVRLDLTGEIKSLKEENLYIPPPSDWIERIDESSGKSFFVHSKSGETTWRHPILRRVTHKRKTDEKETKDEFIGAESSSSQDDAEAPSADEETGFDRTSFLLQEEKRLRLDKKRNFSGKKIDEVIQERLTVLRGILGLPPENDAEPLFVGYPKMLLESLKSNPVDARSLFTATKVVFEDFKKLKFNKQQLSGLLDRIDLVIEEESFSVDSTEWIVGALQLASPVGYSVH